MDETRILAKPGWPLPRVSVVMANFCGAGYLEGAIASVLRQSHTELELIVVDDASGDSSVAIARGAMARDPRVRLIEMPQNAGPSAARNAALAAASGDWIAIVDSDDLIHPERIERLLAAARRLSADVVADDLIFFGETAQVSGRTLLGSLALAEPIKIGAELFVSANTGASDLPPFGYLKPLIRREALTGLRYDEALRIGEDYDLYLRLLLSEAEFFLVPDALYLYRRHTASVSHRLSVPTINAMIAAHDDCVVEVPVQNVSLLSQLSVRRSALVEGLAYEAFVAALKRHSFGQAFAMLVSQPALLHRLTGSLHERYARNSTDDAPAQRGPKTLLLVSGSEPAPQQFGAVLRIDVPPFEPAGAQQRFSSVWAQLSTLSALYDLHVVALGKAGLFALWNVPRPLRVTALLRDEAERQDVAHLIPADAQIVVLDTLPLESVSKTAQVPQPIKGLAMPHAELPLVHFRTPTYRRGIELVRCLASMQAQTWPNWVCDVYDDDPEGSGRSVVEGFGDARIKWHQNRPQRFASRNIDACFSRDNPHNADWFCVVEDDNLILPDFAAENIALAMSADIRIVFRNQLIEYGSGTPDARLGVTGILDDKFREGVYQSDLFRLSMIADIGVSNGGLFWSRHAKTDLEIGFDCNATLQEYLRTYAIAEPIYVALKPLAVWADNGQATTRDLGDAAKYLRRELNLKRSVQILRRRAWQRAGSTNRASFLGTEDFVYDPQMRAAGLIKSLIVLRAGGVLPLHKRLELAARGLLIRAVGQKAAGLQGFFAARG